MVQNMLVHFEIGKSMYGGWYCQPLNVKDEALCQRFNKKSELMLFIKTHNGIAVRRWDNV